MTKARAPLAVARAPGVVTAARLLRLRDAPRYLGMDKNRLNREVRPCVTVIPSFTRHFSQSFTLLVIPMPGLKVLVGSSSL